MNELPVFVINLDSSPERLERLRARLDEQGVAFTRIAATDGRLLDLEKLDTYDRAGAINRLGRPLNGGEVGCFLSHIRALEAFVDTGAPFGLILEDDAELHPAAIPLCHELLRWQGSRKRLDWWIANLGALRMKITSPLTWLTGHGTPVEVVRAHYFPMLSTGMIWTREGAQEFLRICPPFDRPYDVFLRHWLMETDHGIATGPPLFVPSGAASDIDKSQGALRRGAEGRSKFYGWLKIKRAWRDNLRAMRYKALATRTRRHSE